MARKHIPIVPEQLLLFGILFSEMLRRRATRRHQPAANRSSATVTPERPAEETAQKKALMARLAQLQEQIDNLEQAAKEASEKGNKTRLGLAAAALVRQRLDQFELSLSGGRGQLLPQQWVRLCHAICPEYYTRQERHEATRSTSVTRPQCVMHETGELLDCDHLPDTHALVYPQAANGVKGARTINGVAAPLPIAVRIAGPGAITRQQHLALLGVTDPDELAGDYYNAAPHLRRYEEHDQDGNLVITSEEQGRASRVTATR